MIETRLLVGVVAASLCRGASAMSLIEAQRHSAVATTVSIHEKASAIDAEV
jgi:hypothetical protein